MSLHVCLGDFFFFFFFFFSRLAIFWKKLSFWLSACSVLIMVPLLSVLKFFPFGVLERKMSGNCIDS